MLPQNLIVGIDVSKEWLDVAVGPKVERIENRAVPIRALANRLAGEGHATVGMEPTGGYERLPLALLRAAGLTVLKVDSWRCRQFAKASGARAKTDPLDARSTPA